MQLKKKKKKSENIGYKFLVVLILGILPCVLYHWIEIQSAYFLMYCLTVYLN